MTCTNNHFIDWLNIFFLYIILIKIKEFVFTNLQYIQMFGVVTYRSCCHLMVSHNFSTKHKQRSWLIWFGCVKASRSGQFYFIQSENKTIEKNVSYSKQLKICYLFHRWFGHPIQTWNIINNWTPKAPEYKSLYLIFKNMFMHF